MTISVISEQKSFAGLQGVYSHIAESTLCNMTFSVYIPEHAKNQKLPVLYYLSGLTCTYENVTTKGGFQRIANELGLIVVCPDTSPRGSEYPEEHDAYDFGSGAGFYLNAMREPWSATYKMYDYIVDELPEVIECNFPIDANRAGIFGHSMGGHGALTIGLKNPEKFQSVSAFAPITAPSQCPWGLKAFNGYLGDNPTAWAQYDATQLMLSGHKSKNRILIDQGCEDEYLQIQLKPELFKDACKQSGQELELRMQPGYDHYYYFISSFMEDHLRFHAKNLRLI